MYLPAHFAEHDTEQLYAMMRTHPLATLITQGSDGSEANHLPLRLDPADGVLRLVGHVARANPLWREHPVEVPVLAIFHGPQTYVTPSWYPGKQDHGKAVPTWNYVAVHVRGRLRIIEDADWLRAQLDTLVDEHEAGFAEPWHVADAPVDYIEKMISAIVGIEIEITAMQGKWKLSQNQPAANRTGVIAGLHQRNQPDAAAVAALMARRETPDAG